VRHPERVAPNRKVHKFHKSSIPNERVRRPSTQ